MRRTPAAFLVAFLIMLGLGTSHASAWENGKAPASAMSPIATTVKCDPLQGQLANEAAAGWNTMALAAGERLAINGCDSAYRPYDRQVYMKNYWCALGACQNAATPGYSNHGWGLATDNPTTTLGYIALHGKRFGWCKCWSDAPWESWHVTYRDVFNRPNPGPNLHSPTLRQHSGGPGQNVYVRKVQKLLRGHGDKTVTVDGSFGWQTRKAVERFQRAQRLKVNGVVSKRVWKRLRRPISKPVKTTPVHVAPAGTAPPPAKPHHKKKHHQAPKNRKAWGIDISSNNGCPATGNPAINFRKVRRDGATFAITKSTESTTYVNPCFGRAQVRAIGSAGLVPGVYHWLTPGGASGKAEAAFFANTIGHAGYGKGFLQPFVDVEEHSGISSAAYCRELGEFVHTLKRVLGEKPIIYSTPSFVTDELGGAACGYLDHYRLWIAHLGVRHPDVPAPFGSWALWQYTWTAHVAGVPGEVDVSKVYGGTRALATLRVRDLPRRVRKAPRAKLELPLAAESRGRLLKAAPDNPHPPAADATPPGSTADEGGS
jgi:lysozyme